MPELCPYRLKVDGVGAIALTPLIHATQPKWRLATELLAQGPILTNGKVTGDNVGPHADLLGDFPYVGPPHNA